jgi:hypothetical protein
MQSPNPQRRRLPFFAFFGLCAFALKKEAAAVARSGW